jgi:hypothetical protein
MDVVMGSDPGFSKFAELRAKTDRQLVALAGDALARGLDAARGLNMARNGCARERRANAEGAFAEAIKLLLMVYDLDQAERARIQAQMHELREILGADSLPARPRIRTAGA